MNLYAYLRKFFAGLLGVFWGYRADVAVKQLGLSLEQYIPTFIVTMIFLGILFFLIHKEKGGTVNAKILKREILEDVLFAVLFLFIEYLAPNIFGFILPSA
jgi:uncharacterized membrane protein